MAIYRSKTTITEDRNNVAYRAGELMRDCFTPSFNMTLVSFTVVNDKIVSEFVGEIPVAEIENYEVDEVT